MSVMTVKCTEHRLRGQVGSLDIAGPSNVPASPSLARQSIRVPVPPPNMYLPPQAVEGPFRQGLIGNGVMAPWPFMASQGPAMRPLADNQQPARVPIRHQTVIIQNLQFEITDSTLEEFLNTSIGRVQHCKIEKIDDKKCHAFVTFAGGEQAEKAVKKLDHCNLFGREVTVRLTKEGQKGPIIADGSM